METCPWCGYDTFIYGVCASCGFGITTEPILEKDAEVKSRPDRIKKLEQELERLKGKP